MLKAWWLYGCRRFCELLQPAEEGWGQVRDSIAKEAQKRVLVSGTGSFAQLSLHMLSFRDRNLLEVRQYSDVNPSSAATLFLVRCAGSLRKRQGPTFPSMMRPQLARRLDGARFVQIVLPKKEESIMSSIHMINTVSITKNMNSISITLESLRPSPGIWG